MPRHFHRGFTLLELLVSTAIFSTVALGVVAFMGTSMGLIIRNLSTNHTHDTIRGSGTRLLTELHGAASRFRLLNFDGTNYTDASPTATSDRDTLTQQFTSTRANGVRFYRPAGGPYQLTANTSATSTSLRFNFAVGGAIPYVPQAGDRLVLPLISREFGITAVTTSPTAGNPNGVVTIDDAAGLGLSVTIGTDRTTTAYFYRKSAYVATNGELRYHENFEGAARGQYIVVRDNVTSPKPFAILFPTSTSLTSDELNLRVSLESAERTSSARSIRGSTTTLHTVIPVRNQPPEIANTN